jgi:hypothetical protein
MVFFGTDFVFALYKQTPCAGKYGKKIDTKTQLGLLSIGFVLLVDCFLIMCSEIALGFVSTRGLCFLPSSTIDNDFIFTVSVCLSSMLSCINTVQDKI